MKGEMFLENLVENNPKTGEAYVVLEHPIVTDRVSIKNDTNIRKLRTGDIVNILETVEIPEESRIRGRIEDGWVSIERTSDGFLWMVPKDKNKVRSKRKRIKSTV